jgi:hypothetical protein
MAEKSVGRRATRRRSIEPGRILAPGEIVNPSSADGVVASNSLHLTNAQAASRFSS